MKFMSAIINETLSNLNVIKLTSCVNHKSMMILINLVSSHNFLSQMMVDKYEFKIEDVETTTILLGGNNGPTKHR